MALKVTFNQQDSLREHMAVARQIEADIIQSQSYAGETFVKDCREQIQSHAAGTYIDDTTNLRNSIGYFIRVDGDVVKQKIEGSGEGVQAAMSALNDVPKRKGIQLIGLAGMNYASYVESKGYNVMSKQADFAIVDLSGYYKTIENKYR